MARPHADHHVSSAHGQFGKCVCRFVAREILPYHAAWEEAGVVPREAWRQAGEADLSLRSKSRIRGSPHSITIFGAASAFAAAFSQTRRAMRR
ncbi:MAG: acyl-CoA dehydrogenase family protein [Roseomonas sp.]|nr:acyl-CoA dehydrogenase family protein [Roseomonas sp.]